VHWNTIYIYIYIYIAQIPIFYYVIYLLVWSTYIIFNLRSVKISSPSVLANC
jgi:hypothetical protein